jgi:hypothetical protein
VKKHQEKVETKAKRAAKKKKKIREGIQNDRESKKHGHYYSTGCAVAKPEGEDETAEVVPPPAKKKTKKKPPATKKQTEKNKQATKKTTKKRGTKRKAIAEPETGGEVATTATAAAKLFPTVTLLEAPAPLAAASVPAQEPGSVRSTQKKCHVSSGKRARKA